VIPTVVKENSALKAVTFAWLFTSLFYFYQYMLRSAPAVMTPELSHAYGLSAAGLASLVGVFYYGYATFSLVSGVAMDQIGPRLTVPAACVVVALGSLLFASGHHELAVLGRFMQGVGGVFALIGAAYIVSSNFPASRAATLIGATQMFGMAGGSAGQFLVGPAITNGLAWNEFWIGMGVIGFFGALLLLLFIPPQKKPGAAAPADRSGWARTALAALIAVFRNPQTILCGLISAMMFLPTTIFDMVWGVRYLQEGHDVPYTLAVMRSAAVPFGWIIGCPLLGWLSDRIGRRKPVIIGGAAVLLASLTLILFGPTDVFPPYSLGLVAGIGSGAAMIPYTVVKEANRSEFAGTATGVINFIVFTMSALLGPVTGQMLTHVSGGGPRALVHYQVTFQPLIYGVAVAILLTLLLRETGTAAKTRAQGATQRTSLEPGTKRRPIAGH
jgi:MFS family permease